MNSDKTLYDWKRYWIPHESHEESYFEYSSLYNNNEKSTLSNLRDKKCLILLGDAALGKSTVLNQEYKALQKADIGVYFIDLKYVGDYTSLRDKFIDLKKYCNGKSKVYLLLDSFDESQLIFNNIVNCLIDNLKSLDLEKIYIRITCRTVVFPQYLFDELKQLSYRGKERFEFNNAKDIFKQQFKIINNSKETNIPVEIYKLLPLNKDDINKVLEYKNINKDDFYNKTLLSEELKTPITALYIIDNYENLDNMSQFEIYNNICLQLCNEYNGQSNKQILNSNERIKVAATLFTIMLFSNKYSISYDKNVYEYSNNNTFYTQKYFGDIKNILDILRFAIPASNIEEVLNTGLFTGNYDSITFIQKTYMEFLVAKFILDCNLYDNFKNLIFDEYDKVLSSFVNTICWLADQNDAIFEEVYSKDPDILLTSIVSFASEVKNIKILKKFYELLKSDSGIYGLNSYSYILRKLSISKDVIIETIEEYLKSNDSTYVTISIQLLDINNILEFEDYIFNIAISKEYSFHCRVEALYFLKKHSSSYFYEISNYIDNFIVDDKEESSRYAYILINLLLPNHLSETNLKKIINQNLDDNFYYHAEPDIIAQNKDFHRIILSRLIQQFLEGKRDDTNFIDKLLKSLVKNLPFDNVEYVANFIYDVLNCCYLHSLHSELYSLFENINRNLKYEIFNYLFNNVIILKNQAPLYVSYYRFFFDKHDLAFLIKQFIKSQDKMVKKLLYDLFINTSFLNKIIYYVSYIWYIIKDVKHAIKNKKLTYHQYHLHSLWDKLKILFNKNRNIYYQIKNLILRKRPIDLLRKILNKPVFSEYDWNNCIYFLSYIKDNKKRTFSLCPINYEYIEEYSLLSSKEQQQLFNLAKFYAENQSYDTTKINNRLTTNSFNPYANMLIVPAMFFLYMQDEKVLRNLIGKNDLIKRSLPYIINYPIDNSFYNEIKSCRIELLQYCINNNESEFLRTLEQIIDIKLSIQDNEVYLEFLEDFYSINNEQLNYMFFQKLSALLNKDTHTKSELYIIEHIGRYLTIKNYNSCIELFTSILSSENKSNHLKAIIAKFLAHYNNSTFGTYKDLLDNNEEFAKEFICNVSRGCFATDSYQYNNQIKLNLNSVELAQFFIILEKYYPSSEDTYPNGIVTSRDEISDLRRIIINKCINDGDLKFFNYIKDNSELNIQAFWISNTKRNYTKLQYQYITVDDLITMITKENSHIILNNSHLYDVILKALHEIQLEIRKDSGYLRVWNESDNTCWPKDEKALSDELKRLLKSKLDNMVVNREVEISPKISGTGSNLPDLLVECQTSESIIASVIIEVKGCWNPDIRESIKTQLYDRYMCDDTGFNYGIYLIGWYWCDKWDSEKKKGKIQHIKVDNRFPETDINETIDYFNKQSKILSNNGKKVKSIVLDLSLPN